MKEKKLVKFEFGGHCPVRDVISHLGNKWSVLTLMTLKENGRMRFGEIKCSIGDVSQRMLTITLRSMETDGIVSRMVHAEIPPRVEYELTELGESLFPHLKALVDWAEESMDEILSNRSNFQK